MLDALTTNDEWNFPVESQPVLDINGNQIPGYQNLMRTDTNVSVGLHGSRYRMISHDHVINSLVDAARDADIGHFEMNVAVIEGGRRLRAEILFPDLVIQPKIGDHVQFRVTALNSYDASWPFQQSADALRLWCLNGCTTPDHVAHTRMKHTANVDVSASASKISAAMQHFLTRGDEWRHWMTVEVSDEMAEHFFKNTVAFVPRHQVKNSINERQLENLMGLWKSEHRNLGKNKWALYNTLTYWATHTEGLTNPLITQRNRENIIARAMRHNLWKEAA